MVSAAQSAVQVGGEEAAGGLLGGERVGWGTPWERGVGGSHDSKQSTETSGPSPTYSPPCRIQFSSAPSPQPCQGVNTGPARLACPPHGASRYSWRPSYKDRAGQLFSIARVDGLGPRHS